jgi:lysozyme
MATNPRIVVAALSLSAAAFGGMVLHESYSDKAIIPVRGDVQTIGFGTTEGVKMGDTITPPKAVVRALQDVAKFEGAVKQCVTVPLASVRIRRLHIVGLQHRADGVLRLDAGAPAQCGRLRRRACRRDPALEPLQGGRELRGLTLRRQDEFKQCMGEAP